MANETHNNSRKPAPSCRHQSAEVRELAREVILCSGQSKGRLILKLFAEMLSRADIYTDEFAVEFHLNAFAEVYTRNFKWKAPVCFSPLRQYAMIFVIWWNDFIKYPAAIGAATIQHYLYPRRRAQRKETRRR